MAKKDEKTTDQLVDMGSTLSKTEQFIEKNQKMLLIAVAAIVIVVGGYLLYKKMYIGPKEKEAQTAMFAAQRYFDKDSTNLALNGDGNNLGFLAIIDDYSMTKSGNLANYYAGICFLKKGEFQKAIDYLEKFKSDDAMVGTVAIGAIGDAYMELGNVDKAISYYEKASNTKPNKFLTPMFMMKAAWAYEEQNKWDDAIKIYEKLRADYVKSQEGKDAEKYLARAKAMKIK